MKYLWKQTVASQHDSVHVGHAAPGGGDAVAAGSPPQLVDGVVDQGLLHDGEDGRDLERVDVGIESVSQPLKISEIEKKNS